MLFTSIFHKDSFRPIILRETPSKEIRNILMAKLFSLDFLFLSLHNRTFVLHRVHAPDLTDQTAIVPHS